MKNVKKKIGILGQENGRAGPTILKLSMKKTQVLKRNLENKKIIQDSKPSGPNPNLAKLMGLNTESYMWIGWMRLDICLGQMSLV